MAKEVEMQRGFTLVELVTVIIIIGILAVVAAPKFINLSIDAERALFDASYGSFRSAIQQSHICWRLRANGAASNDLQCGQDATLNALDYNSQGYPVGLLEGGVKSIGNEHDCLLLWSGLLDTDIGLWSASDGRSPAVPREQASIQSEFIGNQSCRYTLLADGTSAFEYDSINGTVIRL